MIIKKSEKDERREKIIDVALPIPASFAISPIVTDSIFLSTKRRKATSIIFSLRSSFSDFFIS